MKNFLFVIAFLVVLTSIIVCINPQMHKPMNIGGAELVIQNDSNIKNTELKVENKDSITDKKTTNQTSNTQATSNSNYGIYVDEKITTPITQIAGPQVNELKSLNFSSPTFSEDLKKNIQTNVDFPKNNVVTFSFSYTKQGTIANIHIISISGDDYHDGNDYYAARVYGDVCKRDGLKENQIYIAKDTRTADLTIDTINNTKEGKYLVKLYDFIKNIGKTHSIEIPPYERDAEFSTIGGMYYQGNLYINQ